MGSIETKIDIPFELTVNTVKGQIVTKDVTDWLNNYYSDTVTRLILWDFREADLSKIKTEDFREIVKDVKKISLERVDGKTAFVVKRDFEFGIGRMMEAFGEIEKMHFESRSFRNMDDAKKWLGI